MDERFEALCEIGELVISGGRSDLIETYYELLCEHYPVEILTHFALEKSSSEDESEDEGPPLELEPEPEPPLKEMGEEIKDGEDKLEEETIDYEDSEDEGYGSDLTDESIDIKCDENGFLSLA
tara:strand:+ start:217 stop:585 length:369 start_codon:yes stop_codon:yes gene_type:complete